MNRVAVASLIAGALLVDSSVYGSELTDMQQALKDSEKKAGSISDAIDAAPHSALHTYVGQLSDLDASLDNRITAAQKHFPITKQFGELKTTDQKTWFCHAQYATELRAQIGKIAKAVNVYASLAPSDPENLPANSRISLERVKLFDVKPSADCKEFVKPDRW